MDSSFNSRPSPPSNFCSLTEDHGGVKTVEKPPDDVIPPTTPHHQVMAEQQLSSLWSRNDSLKGLGRIEDEKFDFAIPDEFLDISIGGISDTSLGEENSSVEQWVFPRMAQCSPQDKQRELDTCVQSGETMDSLRESDSPRSLPEPSNIDESSLLHMNAILSRITIETRSDTTTTTTVETNNLSPSTSGTVTSTSTTLSSPNSTYSEEASSVSTNGCCPVMGSGEEHEFVAVCKEEKVKELAPISDMMAPSVTSSKTSLSTVGTKTGVPSRHGVSRLKAPKLQNRSKLPKIVPKASSKAAAPVIKSSMLPKRVVGAVSAPSFTKLPQPSSKSVLARDRAGTTDASSASADSLAAQRSKQTCTLVSHVNDREPHFQSRRLDEGVVVRREGERKAASVYKTPSRCDSRGEEVGRTVTKETGVNAVGRTVTKGMRRTVTKEIGVDDVRRTVTKDTRAKDVGKTVTKAKGHRKSIEVSTPSRTVSVTPRVSKLNMSVTEDRTDVTTTTGLVETPRSRIGRRSLIPTPFGQKKDKQSGDQSDVGMSPQLVSGDETGSKFSSEPFSELQQPSTNGGGIKSTTSIPKPSFQKSVVKPKGSGLRKPSQVQRKVVDKGTAAGKNRRVFRPINGPSSRRVRDEEIVKPSTYSGYSSHDIENYGSGISQGSKVVHSPLDKENQTTPPRSKWSPIKKKRLGQSESCFQCTKRAK